MGGARSTTGDYYVEVKLAAYQARGDAEVWLVHPYKHTVTSWVRQTDGSYSRRVVSSGLIEPVEPPGIKIDVDTLFA